MAKKRKNIYAFKRGYGLIAIKDADTVKDEIMNALNISSRTQWYARINGRVVPNMEEKAAIETIFQKHKVKLKDIWGI